nr:hypothetical protein [Tanacetum cinerariifolium]
MVNAQAVYQAFCDEFENLRMGGFEHLRTLDLEAAQFVDVEEASPVDVVPGRAPAGQAVVLMFEQTVQLLEAFRLTGVELRQPGFDGV